MNPATDRVIVLVGPTAAGKSTLAVTAASTMIDAGHPCEVVNLDSMVVYRGMDIGTAKPSAEDQLRVRHHLVDILDITETATVAEFQQRARETVADIHTRGALPLLVGGSALYTRAVIDQFSFPGTDPELRADLEDQLARSGPTRLHDRLAELDPAAAAEILPGNGRRIVRALEVIMLTNEPYAASLPSHEYALAGVVQVGIDGPRDWLDERIEQRVHQMWAAGFVDEVRVLADRGLRDGRTASKALGYRQVLAFLDGEIDEDEAMRRTIAATRRFARKQRGWHRRDDRVRWFDAREPEVAVREIVALGTDRPAVEGVEH
ncbi:tRNA (adenosine(37)-N6)-dimethylallyltransferase MiaA [Propionibacteriaceae bacterium Y2011]